MSNISKLPSEVKALLLKLVQQDGVVSVGTSLTPVDSGVFTGHLVVWFKSREYWEGSPCGDIAAELYEYFDNNGWIPEESWDTIISLCNYEFRDSCLEDFPGMEELTIEEVIKEIG